MAADRAAGAVADVGLSRRELVGDPHEVMICGLVLHAGPHTFPFDERIGAAPIAALWS